MENKCEHPEDKVRTVYGKHQPWEGTCAQCGAEVKLKPVKCTPNQTDTK